MNEPVPCVSVVVPAFNSARWIEETLASVAAQSIGSEKLEVVVVDDGSGDGTADVAERYLAGSALRWRVVRQANRGPGAARNVGWRAASGEWIQFLDADDVLDPEKIELQWNVSLSVDEDTAVIYSSWRKFGLLDPRWEDGEPVTPHVGTDAVTDLLYSKHGIATGSQLYHRNWLQVVGGWDVEYPNGEDHALAFRTAFAGGRFVDAASERPLFFYRRHGPSLSTHSGRANAEVWLRIARYVEEESTRRGELSERRLTRLKALYAGSAIWLADYDWPAAKSVIDHLLRLDPDFRLQDRRKLRVLCSLFGFQHGVWLGSRLRRLFPVAEPQRVSCELASGRPTRPPYECVHMLK